MTPQPKPMPTASKEVRELLAKIQANSQVLQVDAREQLDTLYESVDDLANVLYREGAIDDDNQWRKTA